MLEENLTEIIALHLKNGPPKLFSTSSTDFIDKRRLRSQLQGVLSTWKTNGSDGLVSPGSMKLYDALVYKFGQSNRHQKFWKATLQIYSELKRINQRNLVDFLEKVAQGLANSNYTCSPSTSATSYVASLMLEKIVRLNRLRLICVKAANLSMGYIELSHLITFNLMLIAIASDIAKDALKHIKSLSQTYDELSYWFRGADKSFPVLSAEFQLRSVPKESSIRPMSSMETVRAITQLLNMSEDVFSERILESTFKNDNNAESVLEKIGISVPRDDERFKTTIDENRILASSVKSEPDGSLHKGLKRKRKNN